MMNIIEIFNDNRTVSVYRGFLRIKSGDTILSDIPLDTIGAVMATGRAIVWTNTCLSRLCELGIPVLFMGDNYHPNGILMSLVGVQHQTAVQMAQIQMSEPLRKQLWREVVREKIRNQARVLDAFHRDNPITNVANRVMSGDSGGCEARAARAYFPALFGQRFVRNRNMRGINSFLNYGYAILRGTLARLVVGAGLNPSFGLQHHNALNPFCLVDDLIEPYRPIVDFVVAKLFTNECDAPIDDTARQLTPVDKAALSAIIRTDFRNTDGSMSPLNMIMQRDVWAVVQSIGNKKNMLAYSNHLIPEHTTTE